jgi:hypothetical protein
MTATTGQTRRVMRSVLAVPVVLSTSTGAATCIIHPYWLQLHPDRYAKLSGQFAVFVVIGAVFALVALAIALASSSILGPGPPIAVGAASGVFGLLVGRDVRQGGEMLVVCLALGFGCGALAGGGLIEAVRAGRARGILVAAWILPFLLVWPWTTWASRHQVLRAGARLAPALPVWLVVAVAGVLVVWSVYALLAEAVGRLPGPRVVDSTQQVWFGTCVAGAVATLFAIALTSDLEAFPEVWIRPMMLVGSGLTIGGLVLACTAASASHTLRISYVCVVAPCLAAPSLLTFIVAQADDPRGLLDFGPLVVLSAVGIVGAGAGWRAPWRLTLAGPALAAAGCIPAWAMPRHDWLMVLTASALVAGLAVSAAAGLAIASTNDTWLLGFVAVVSVLIGTSFVPGLFAEGLLHDVTPLADGRVALGCSLAGFIAVTATSHLARRRVTRETEVTIA